MAGEVLTCESNAPKASKRLVQNLEYHPQFLSFTSNALVHEVGLLLLLIT